MKRSLFRSRLSKLSSFTLIEMLVVIAIIAILASIVAVNARSAINAAKRTQASVIATQIQTAVNNYYTEYSVYPIPSDATPGTDVYFSTNDVTHWKNLMIALCGNVNPTSPGTTATSTVSNTRNIAFLSVRKSDLDTNGIFVTPIAPNSAAGPYFNIAIDGNYDGVLGNNGTANNVIPDFTQTNSPPPTTAVISAGVAVWANCNTSSSSNNNFWVRTW